MKLKTLNNLKVNLRQFFIEWNGLVLALPALGLFILSKIAIFTLTNGQEQGYFWSQLHIISFGLLRLVIAEFSASFLLYVNKKGGFKMLFRNLTKDQQELCGFSRDHALRLYSVYLLAAAILMAFP
ncbi:MAG: hypothetical protein VYB44_07050 [Bacteroidota bacterium]|nr:hypothetical protein [Bacteroidota bacterium]